MKKLRILLGIGLSVCLLACSEDSHRAAFYKSHQSPVLLELGRERDVFLNEPIRPLPLKSLPPYWTFILNKWLVR